MKTILLILLASIASAFAQPAVPALPPKTNAQFQVTWDLPAVTNGVAGYIIRHGTAPGVFTLQAFVAGAGTSGMVWTNAVLGVTNYFEARSVNTNGVESAPSNVIARELAPGTAPPQLKTATPITASIQSREPGGLWKERLHLGPFLVENTRAAEEFRVVLNIGKATAMLPP